MTKKQVKSTLAERYNAVRAINNKKATRQDIMDKYHISKQALQYWIKSYSTLSVEMKNKESRDWCKTATYAKRSKATDQSEEESKEDEPQIRRGARERKAPDRLSDDDQHVEAHIETKESEESPCFHHYADEFNTMPSDEAISDLYENSFHVFPAAIDVSDEFVAKLKKKKHNEVIFNDGDKKRRQYVLEPELLSDPVITRTTDFVQHINPNVYADTYASIDSAPGNIRQPAHMDFPPADVVDVENQKKPLLCVLALENGTTNHAWIPSKQIINGCINFPIRPQMIKLNKGDLLVFTGDLIHAGSEYSVRNTRLHCYFPVHGCRRIKNETSKIYLLKGKFAFLKRIIDEELSDEVKARRAHHGDIDF